MNQPDQQAKQFKLQKFLKQGFTALGKGQFKKAGDYCHKILKLDGDCVAGHFLVGLVGLDAKDRTTAFQAFQSVVKLDPDHAPAWAHLSKLYFSEGKVNLADAALRETRRIGSEDPMVLDLVATTLSQMGEHAVAKSFFARANTQRPNFPPFMLNLANCLVYLGERDLSKQVFEDVIRLQPDTPQAHWAMATSQKAKDESHIKMMHSLLKNRENNPRASAFYYYAIGKEYEDMENWSQAFEAFDAGAKARRSSVEFDEAAEIEMFDFLQQKFTPQWFDKTADGNPSNAPIFVLGQPRTGTTLIERIITSHSQVHSAGELQQFGLALRRLSQYQNPKRFTAELFEKAMQLDPAKIGGLYLQSSQRMQGDTPYFVDKLPQNYLMIPLILKALPNAKIVHLVRNPMDACFSSFKQLFADAYLHSYDQLEMARHHVRYRQLMATWREHFGDRFIDVSYEDTTRDLETNARRLIDFLGLPWEEACLHFHQQKAAVSTASAVQVREPAHTRSIDRWKKYEIQLQPMLDCLQTNGVDI